MVHKHQEADFESELSFQKLKGSQGYLYRWDQKELLDTKKTRKWKSVETVPLTNGTGAEELALLRAHGAKFEINKHVILYYVGHMKARFIFIKDEDINVKKL